MQQTTISLLTGSVVAAGTLAANRLVTAAGAYPSAGGPHYGCTRSSALVGDQTPVDVIGTAIVETGGPVTAFGPVEVDGSGRVVDFDSGIVVGRAMNGASGLGPLVEVLLFQVA